MKKHIHKFEDFKEKISLKDAIKLSQKSDIIEIGEWLDKNINDIEFYYKKEPITLFNETIDEMESTFEEFPEDLERAEKILKLLKKGKKPMSIFIKLDDQERFILEGRHRIVAFNWYGMKDIPVIYVK